MARIGKDQQGSTRIDKDHKDQQGSTRINKEHKDQQGLTRIGEDRQGSHGSTTIDKDHGLKIDQEEVIRGFPLSIESISDRFSFPSLIILSPPASCPAPERCGARLLSFEIVNVAQRNQI